MPGETPLKILLYWPNLIGYLRVLLLAAAFLHVTTRPVLFTILYSLQALLDWLDGAVARYFNQTSAFGAWVLQLRQSR
eukprot:m.24024 g.24024  ORF g.24024 m.24024 type:complete len:78 (-) comp11465_c0_seq1:542-775(-)